LGAAQVEQHRGAVDGSAYAGEFTAVLDQVAAGTLDHTCGDGPDLRQIVHAGRIALQVGSDFGARATFSEDFDAASHYARCISGARALLIRLARTAGAEASARLALKKGAPANPDTLLHLLHHTARTTTPDPHALSLDDLSLRHRRTYAMIFSIPIVRSTCWPRRSLSDWRSI
jgi:hypothetical protein